MKPLGQSDCWRQVTAQKLVSCPSMSVARQSEHRMLQSTHHGVPVLKQVPASRSQKSPVGQKSSPVQALLHCPSGLQLRYSWQSAVLRQPGTHCWPWQICSMGHCESRAHCAVVQIEVVTSQKYALGQSLSLAQPESDWHERLALQKKPLGHP